MNQSGMSILSSVGGGGSSTFFNKAVKKDKVSAMSQPKRHRLQDQLNGNSTDRNSLYDTYHKIQTLKAGIK